MPAARSAGPADVEHSTADDRFWHMAGRAGLIGAVAHLCFLVLFASLGLWLLSAVNVLSIGVYLAVMAGMRRRRYGAMQAIAVELFVHALVAGWVLGWDSGFHYYLLLAVPVALQAEGRRWHRLVVAGGAGASYVAMSLWLEGAPPHSLVPAGLVLGLRLMNICAFVGILGNLSLFYAQMVRTSQNRLRTMAERDLMTGLYNRGSLMRLAENVATAPPGHGTWLVFVDIDRFKRINDHFGHARGDEAICAVANLIRQVIRREDRAARWGGEEFLVLLPDADKPTAMSVAERIRRSIAEETISAGDTAGDTAVSVTVGVAERHPGEAFDVALNRADAALYLGKANGRNRVELAA